MRIYSSEPKGVLCGDYFYNYFDLGVDILFDSKVRLSLQRPRLSEMCR